LRFLAWRRGSLLLARAGLRPALGGRDDRRFRLLRPGGGLGRGGRLFGGRDGRGLLFLRLGRGLGRRCRLFGRRAGRGLRLLGFGLGIGRRGGLRVAGGGFLAVVGRLGDPARGRVLGLCALLGGGDHRLLFLRFHLL